MCKIIGIDISKKTFDVCVEGQGKFEHKIYANDLKGFRSFKNE